MSALPAALSINYMSFIYSYTNKANVDLKYPRSVVAYMVKHTAAVAEHNLSIISNSVINHLVPEVHKGKKC